MPRLHPSSLSATWAAVTACPGQVAAGGEAVPQPPPHSGQCRSKDREAAHLGPEWGSPSTATAKGKKRTGLLSAHNHHPRQARG